MKLTDKEKGFLLLALNTAIESERELLNSYSHCKDAESAEAMSISRETIKEYRAIHMKVTGVKK